MASTRLRSSDWQDTTVVSDLNTAAEELKQEDGGPILVAGSRSVAQTLLASGLIDELNLQVFPLILGSGMRLFPERPDLIELDLAASRPLANGVVLQTYRPVA